MSGDVGVLLPLQLETLFDPPAPGDDRWRLRVRVVPQPVAVDEHDPQVRDGELEAATVFWRAVRHSGRLREADLDSDRVRDAFGTLARATGPARAAWLATATRGVRQDGAWHAVPLDPPEGELPEVSVVRGMPPRLAVAVWTYAGDGSEALQRIGSLPDDAQPAETTIPDPLELPVPAGPDDLATSWLTDAGRARSLGLLGIYDLPPGLTPDTLGGVVVWGLGEQGPAELFAAHALTGGLGPLPLGAATNSVGGDPTATTPGPGAADVTGWWATVRARVLGTIGTVPGLDHALQRFVVGARLPAVAGPLTAAPGGWSGLGDREAAEALPDDPLPGTGLSRLLTAALWPALWGGALVDEWQVDLPVAAALTGWALEHLSPEGPLPSLRVGEDPYGLLPVTWLGGWAPEDDDPGELRAGLERLRFVLTESVADLHAHLRPDGTVRGAGPARYAALLARGGVSTVYRQVGFGRFPLYDYVEGAEKLATGTVDALDALGLPVRHDAAGRPDVSVRFWDTSLGLPLLRHPHAAYAHREREARSVPLPWLVDLTLGRAELGRLELGGGRRPTSLRELFELPQHGRVELWDEDGGDASEYPWLRRAPDSLLARLLLQSCLTANRWRRDGELETLVRPVVEGDPGADDPQVTAALQLARLLDRGRSDPLEPVDAAAGASPPGSTAYPAPFEPDPGVADRVERALAATLETTSTRVDPWVTAFAWRRLRRLVDGGGARHRLGAYGWVCGPFLGTHGPTSAGLLHTPSLDQTLTATVARDGFRVAAARGQVNERGTVPWDMAVTSRRVRLALELADDLRDGLFLEQALGLRVEQVVLDGVQHGATPSWYDLLTTLRTTWPSHPDDPDPRVVCQGEQALAGLLGPTPPPTVVLGPEQREALEELRAALETLADLVQLEGVHATTTRSTGRTAAAMDVAAGAGPFPELRFPATPAPGLEVATVVLSVLPDAGPAPVAGVAPGAAALAEPAVTAYLERVLGTGWTWTGTFEDERTASVTLAQLGLTPVEALAWSPDQLRALAASAMGARGSGVSEAAQGTFAADVRTEANLAWELTRRDGVVVGTPTSATLGLTAVDLEERDPEQVATLVRAAWRRSGGTPGRYAVTPVPAPAPTLWVVRDELGSVLGLVEGDDEAGTIGGSDDHGGGGQGRRERHRAVRVAVGAPGCRVVDPPELARLQGLCRVLGAPALERDLAERREEVTGSAAAEELRARYAVVHRDLVEARKQATVAAGAQGDTPSRRAAVRRAASWGVLPDRTPQDAAGLRAAVLGVDPPAGATPLRALTRSVARELRARQDAAPRPGRLRGVDAPLTEEALDELHRSDLPGGGHTLAQALSRLVSPQGGLPVLARWRRSDLVARARLVGPDTALEEEWLTQVAPVRRPLARVEAVQLGVLRAGPGAGAPFEAWSSSPGDPWQRAAVAENVRLRTDPPDPGEELRPGHQRDVPRLAVALSHAGAVEGNGDGDDLVAVGLVDAFSEVVPDRVRDTHAAFGFNVPAARAPHLVLLAVPPRAGMPLDEQLLGEILRETRTLMVARTAQVPDLGVLDRVLRTTWLPDDDGSTVSVLSRGAYG
ncbi:hypothetical protein [uncultured Serinicoccus sp.]|uniref:hypothetical protein n=1 Tax=uncultured Serinicoccus sp. TaxID=735514 RepID=UPI002638A980|nr:hypothetical protein [uncultured Serinicoccus sp.]